MFDRVVGLFGGVLFEVLSKTTGKEQLLRMLSWTGFLVEADLENSGRKSSKLEPCQPKFQKLATGSLDHRRNMDGSSTLSCEWLRPLWTLWTLVELIIAASVAMIGVPIRGANLQLYWLWVKTNGTILG